MTESILEEAQRIIFGARNASYGHPRDNFKNIADQWTAYLGWEIKPFDVGLMMILMKVARMENGVYHRDSVVDIAGYAGTVERLQEPVEEAGAHDYSDGPPVELDGVYNGGVVFEPHQWDSLNDIPWRYRLSSRFRDNEGDIWRWSPTGWEWSHRSSPPWIPGSPDASRHDASGPFFEIQR